MSGFDHGDTFGPWAFTVSLGRPALEHAKAHVIVFVDCAQSLDDCNSLMAAARALDLSAIDLDQLKAALGRIAPTLPRTRKHGTA